MTIKHFVCVFCTVSFLSAVLFVRTGFVFSFNSICYNRYLVYIRMAYLWCPGLCFSSRCLLLGVVCSQAIGKHLPNAGQIRYYQDFEKWRCGVFHRRGTHTALVLCRPLRDLSPVLPYLQKQQYCPVVAGDGTFHHGKHRFPCPWESVHYVCSIVQRWPLEGHPYSPFLRGPLPSAWGRVGCTFLNDCTRSVSLCWWLDICHQQSQHESSASTFQWELPFLAALLPTCWFPPILRKLAKHASRSCAPPSWLQTSNWLRMEAAIAPSIDLPE